jgi:uroporphyrinogen decarboxylase
MCYAVEGQGSKSFDKAKGFCFNPEAARFIAKNYRYDYFIFTRKK